MKTIDDNTRDEIISRVIDAPETLTSEDIRLIHEDKELNELYNSAVLCRDAHIAVDTVIPDVETELAKFKAQKKKVMPLYRRWNALMRIAAVFIGVAVSALVVASVMEYRGFTMFTATEKILEEELSAEINTAPVAAVVESETEIVNDKELVYDNVSLEDIMSELAQIYNVSVEFGNDDVKSLRLYVKIERGKTIAEVVSMLGAFEKFDISINENHVIVK